MHQQPQTKTQVDSNGQTATLRFEGDITSASKDAVLGVYQCLPASIREVLLDFSKVGYLNSSGIALIIQLLIDASKTSRKVQTFGLTPHFVKVFTMLGLEKYTSLHSDEQAAKAAAGM